MWHSDRSARHFVRRAWYRPRRAHDRTCSRRTEPTAAVRFGRRPIVVAAVGDDLAGRPVVAVPFRTDRSCDVLHRAASDLPGYTGGLTRPPARRPWQAPEAAHGSGRLSPGRAMGAARIAADHTAGRGGRAISPGNAGVARGRWRKARAGQLRGGRAWAPHPLPGNLR